MKNDRILVACVALVLTTIMGASTSAHAANRAMLVLIDASGSMLAPRNNTDLRGATRFAAAKTFSEEEVVRFARTGALSVAVYTFQDDQTLIPHTAGFVSVSSAVTAIRNLSESDINDYHMTPLAGALCDAADRLRTTFPSVEDTRILQISSDGLENATPRDHRCWGFTDTDASDGYHPESWQFKVNNDATTGTPPITEVVNLFQWRVTANGQGTMDPEGSLTPQARLFHTTISPSTGLTLLEEFFTNLTQATGGYLNTIYDDEMLPVSGDLNGDRCVDYDDAILVARAFGSVVPPVDGRLDINLDGTVDFADYQIQLSGITWTCGRNTYVSRAPLVCKGDRQILIDGQSIDDRGITIDARAACKITIRNSLIVSGHNAITILGDAVVTVDNSIIVGQKAVIVANGRGVLSAKNTIFNGSTHFRGSSQFIDRGGNVFE